LPASVGHLLVRTSGDPASLATMLRKTLRSSAVPVDTNLARTSNRAPARTKRGVGQPYAANIGSTLAARRAGAHRPAETLSATGRSARRSRDPELLHAEADRVRVEAELLGRVARAVDAPVALVEHCLDVRALDGGERPIA